jgi:tetratricopeptide (TPR) repeat protein
MSEKDSDKPKPPSDDRNIAEVDSSTAGLTPDEQLTLVWSKYKALFIKVAVILLVLGIAWYAKGFYSAQKLADIQDAYIEAQLADEQNQPTGANAAQGVHLDYTIAFAENHARHPLAGYARIKAGHAYFKVESFEEAAEHYEAAVTALAKVPELAGLAHVHQAIATYRSGSKDNGKTLLEDIAHNKDYLDVHRGEAYYKLGVIALSEQDLDAYQSHEAAFENAALENASSLLTKLKTFRKQFPSDGFDTLGPIPVPPLPVAASPTGGVSATGAASPTGGAK